MNRKYFLSIFGNFTLVSILTPTLISCISKIKKISGLKNWAGNYTYKADETIFVSSVNEIKDILVNYKKVKALGTQHCFNDIADTKGVQVSTNKINKIHDLNTKNKTVLVGSGIKYGDLGKFLYQNGWALHNLASLPHISIGGACSTATHGSGISNKNLSSAIKGFEIITANGKTKWVDSENDPNLFYAGGVSLGALGIMTKILLKIEPTFNIEQRVFEDLPMINLKNDFDKIMSFGYSVSFFTHWKNKKIDQIWIKSKPGKEWKDDNLFFGAVAAKKNLHPIKSNSSKNCTPQMGVIGPWHERLPHFKMDFTPSNGDELQSEYFVSRSNAFEAIMAIERLNKKISPILFVSEIRCIASDEFWMSMAYGRDSVAIHFTWKPMVKEVMDLLPEIESVLAPYKVRPHWGKIHTMNAKKLENSYPRYNDFLKLRKRLDPDEFFLNSYLKRTFIN